MSNPLLGLNALGQSPWYDNISRSLLQSGALAKLVAEDGIRGLTSNPAIFEKAIAGSADYDEAIAALLAGASLDPMGLYEALAIEDIRAAADLLAGVYKSSGGRDGFVSLEVSPYLAADTEGTIAEARRLWKTVARPNVMIKIPGTPEGMPAIRAVLADGISVNVTLLFSIEAYRAAAEAHVAALEDRVANGLPVTGVSSVASFFISRIDSLVDSKLEQVAQSTPERREQALNLRGKAAIANAKLAHDAWVALIVSPRWQALADAGAFSQRLLWASTSTKNPTYRDVMYVEQLIGPDTVNTMPAPTVEAFRDHGEVRATLGEGKDEARATMFAIAQVGVDFASVTQTLLDDAVRLFADPFDSLLGALARKRQQVLGTRLASQTLRLPPELDASVKALQDEWRKAGKVRRLWARDASLWTGGDEARWLGWLDLVELGLAQCDDLQNFSRDVKTGGFDDAVLLGMGGSSLGPEVLAATLSTAPGHPRLRVLDSTDPAQVLAVEAAVDLSRTLFLVASKSGSTLEPEILRARFFAAVTEQVGAKEAGRRFVAVTDPGSQLEATARRDGWRKIFHGLPSVGGRYSILSAFGLVPAAVMGVPLRRMLESARLMAQSSAASAPPAGNPAVTLGLLLGASAQAGRDKLTVLASPGLAHVGAWLEQLVAESTGKQGIGIVPVDGERVGAPEVYGNDRLFVHLRLSSDDDAAQDAKIAALAAAGHPVVRLELAEALDIAQEFFRFEIATAVAGAVLGIHPFDQPDVEASKIRTKELTTAWERDAQFPSEGEPIASGGGARFFAPDKDATELQALAQGSRDATDMLAAHLARLRAGDYFAVLAYVPMSEATEAPLQALRHAVRDARKVATCLGFGPRFLHSTGQAYKGGPPSGVFLQVTCDDAQDAEIPGRKASFGVVKAAQARGDMEVLVERGRRVLRVHLPADITAALAWLREAVRTAAKRGAE